MNVIDSRINHLNSKDPLVQTRTPWKFIAFYYAFACGISWAVWAPMVLGQDGLKWVRIAPSIPIIVSLGTLGPLLACYFAHRTQTGKWRAVRLFPRNKLRLLWLLFGPILVLFTLFVVFPVLISSGTPREWHWHVGVLAGIWIPMFNYNLLGGPLFEEFGWRGFLQSRMQQVMPPWIAAICVGIMWAAWHLPLFLVQGWSSSSPATFFLILIGFSLVIAVGFNASGGSVAVAILMHSAFNSSPRFMEGYLHGIPMREYPSVEILIASSCLLVGAVISLVTHGRLGTKQEACVGEPHP